MYKNITMKELYLPMANDEVVHLFEVGIQIGSIQLAISAMEELIINDCEDAIVKILDSSFENGYIMPDTPMYVSVAKSLATETTGRLSRYGRAMLRSSIYEGPSQWIEKGRNDAIEYVKSSTMFGARISER